MAGKYTPKEMLIILAAYAYEKQDDPIMSDYAYDELSKELEEIGTNIPDFNASTGFWIHNIDLDRIFLENLLKEHRRINASS